MTINYTVPYDTSSLIDPTRPTLYPVRIDQQHHQLKHRISTQYSNVIYYCSSHEIFAIHLKSRRRELIKSLTWAPQCLDADHGWICAGGSEKGQCAFIKINGDPRPRWTRARRRAEVDDLLPLDLDPESRSMTSLEEHWLERTSPDSPKYRLQYQQLGTEIVNSVKIHKMRSEKKGVEDDVVVIATNNDRTVRIFSLSQSKSLAMLNFPTCMNHASMSPNSEILLAVGDEPKAFFHRRILFENVSTVGEKSYATYGWQAFAEPRLPTSAVKDMCFSTSFSPTGHVCAVASQSGIITVYDLARLARDMHADGAVICSLKTSRSSVWPNTSGAVRSLNFSPPPWDLLVWAEDQGQISVVDLRDPPISKQTLELSTDPSAVVKAQLEEHADLVEGSQLDIEHRRFLESHRAALHAQDHLAAVTNTADYVEYAASRNHRERDTLIDEEHASRSDSDGLTEIERQMVDALGIRRANLGDGDNTDYSSPPNLSSNTSGFSRHNLDTNPVSGTTSAVPHGGNSAGGPLQPRSTASIAEYVRQRNLERLRMLARSQPPRRRSSVVLSNAGNTDAGTDTPSSSRVTNLPTFPPAPTGTTPVTLSVSPSRLETTSTEEPSTSLNADENPPSSRSSRASGCTGAWQTITDAFTSTYANSLNPETEARRHRPVEALLPATPTDRLPANRDRSRWEPSMEFLLARQRHSQLTSAAQSNLQTNIQRLRQMHAEIATQGTRGDLPTDFYEVLDSDIQDLATTVRRPDGGVYIMGVGWSVDGRNLYIATENGILEYAVNVRQRMQWPGMSFA